MSTPQSLRHYFPPTSHPSKAKLDALLDDIYQHKDYFSYIAHIPSGRYFHISPSFQSLTGHPKSLIEEKNVRFFVENVPEEDTLKVMELQARYLKMPFEPGFDHDYPYINEFRARIRKPDNSLHLFVGLTVILSYFPTRELETGLIIAFMASNEEALNTSLRAAAVHMLEQVKKYVVEIYPHPIFKTVEKPLTGIILEVDPKQILTKQEQAILKRIAQGETTKKIAEALSITVNTVETHRKNMLVKFDAKNVAELMKKASKRYWLE